MNELQRFKAVVNFEKPDYIPIFAFPWVPGISYGTVEPVRKKLISQGMPEWVGRFDYDKTSSSSPDFWSGYISSGTEGAASWMRYWGTTGPLTLDFLPAGKSKGFAVETRIEGDYEIIESESGAITRQVLNNEETYSMPEFIRFDVRDRASWELYKDRKTPGPLWSSDKIDEVCRKYDGRTRPLSVSVMGTWGYMRDIAGPEKALLMLYDDPELAHEIIDWFDWIRRTYIFPLIRRLKPEILQSGEDICYNHGMLISPGQFREFCGRSYTSIAQIGRECGADLIAVDSDGNVMEFAPLVEELGFNGLYPFEVKSNNDMMKIRREHPRFVIMGGLEKEVLNEGGGGGAIEAEIMSKVPGLLKYGGYFPNNDHGIQPMITFENLCRFMTLLHEVTENPEGEFPRIK